LSPDIDSDIYRDLGITRTGSYTKYKYRKKGICSYLTQNLLSNNDSKNLFATCKIKNREIQSILIKNKFLKIGKPIMGTMYNCKDYFIQLFIKEINILKL